MLSEQDRIKINEFVAENAQGYMDWQKSTKWDEKYKWDILGESNKKLDELGNPSLKNESEIVALLTKANPTSGTFIHFSYLSHLKDILKEHPGIVAQLLQAIWSGNYELANTLYKDNVSSGSQPNLGAPYISFTMAVKDPRTFPLYRYQFYASICVSSYLFLQHLVSTPA